MHFSKLCNKGQLVLLILHFLTPSHQIQLTWLLSFQLFCVESTEWLQAWTSSESFSPRTAPACFVSHGQGVMLHIWPGLLHPTFMEQHTELPNTSCAL